MDCAGTDGGISEYLWVLPGLVVAVLIAVVVRDTVGRCLGSSPRAGFVLAIAVGAIVAATLAPARVPLAPWTTASCDASRVGLAPWADYLVFDAALLNVALFAPLGVVVGFLPVSRKWAIVLVGAVALPFAVEALQLLATPLGRACESADVSDNLAGLAIGLALGIAASRTVGRSVGRGAPPGSDAGAEGGHDDGERRGDLDEPDVDRSERARA